MVYTQLSNKQKGKNKMNYSEYYAEINSIAESLVAEAMAYHDNDDKQAMDDIMDCRLHEAIDGHRWIIYNSYNLSITEHSGNDEYMIDNMGEESAVEALKSGGLSGLRQAFAYWAMYADVSELLQDKMDEFIDSLDIEEEE